MYSWQRIAFWCFVGVCLGFGLITFGLGLVPFIFGALVALYGIHRFGAKGFWIALVSCGVVPIGVMTAFYLAAPSTTTLYAQNPFAPLAIAFSPIILAGLLWGYREQRHRRTAQHG
jgi:hypothetical protein